MTSSPLFGVLLTLIAFQIGLYISKKTGIVVFNPLLIAIIFIIGILTVFKVPYVSYNTGGQYITFLLIPGTIVMAVPLYKKIELIKKDFMPIMVGIIVGSTTAVLSVVLLSKLFKLPEDLTLSLVPKSITTAIGVEVSQTIGGLPAITTTAIIVTGILGAILSPLMIKVFRVKDKIAAGIGIGTSSHAIGTSKALEIGEVEGAMSSAAIGLAGIVTAIIAPIIMTILN